jgi:hypothetical protein
LQSDLHIYTSTARAGSTFNIATRDEDVSTIRGEST